MLASRRRISEETEVFHFTYRHSYRFSAEGERGAAELPKQRHFRARECHGASLRRGEFFRAEMHRSSIFNSSQPRDTKSSSCEEHDDAFLRRRATSFRKSTSPAFRFYGDARAIQGEKFRDDGEKIRSRIGGTLTRCNFNAF